MAAKKKEASLSIEDKLRAALVPDDEQPYPIPEDWVWTRLGEISLDPQYGWTTSAASEGDVRLLRTTDITSGQIDWSSVPYCKEIPADLEKYLIRDGDIVISRAGSVGFSHLIINPEKAVFASYLIRFKPLIVQEYLAHFLKSQTYWDAISESSSGIAVPNVNASKLKQISIPVAPLLEQRRIADKLESLLGKIKEAKAFLDEIPEILQNFRQSVLAAACSGKLTKDWRKVNPNVVLSGPIAASLAQNDLPGLPATWNITSIDQIGTVKGGKRLPKGDMLVEYDTGYPYIKAGNLKNGTVITDQMEFLTPQSQKRIKNYTVSGGDVYITIVGAYIGDAGVIPGELDRANLTENAAKICNLVNCNNRYLAFWLRSEKSQTIIRDRISSATQGKLALFRIKSLPVPLPPLPEQQEIVRRVESLFSKADDLEAQYKEAMELIEILPEIILSKAFRGELVPQNPNDEQAVKLLERILREKESFRVDESIS